MMLQQGPCPFCLQAGTRCPTHEAVYQRSNSGGSSLTTQQTAHSHPTPFTQQFQKDAQDQETNPLGKMHLTSEMQRDDETNHLHETGATDTSFEEDALLKVKQFIYPFVLHTASSTIQRLIMPQALTCMTVTTRNKKEKRAFNAHLREATNRLPGHLYTDKMRIEKSKSNKEKQKEVKRKRRELKAEQQDQQAKIKAKGRIRRKAQNKAALKDVRIEEREQLAEWKAEKERVEIMPTKTRSGRHHEPFDLATVLRLHDERHEPLDTTKVIRNQENSDPEDFLARASNLLEETLTEQGHNMSKVARGNIKEVLSLVNTFRLLRPDGTDILIKKEPMDDEMQVPKETNPVQEPEVPIKQEPIEEDVMQDS